MYGPWRVEASDVTEVNAYRAGINLTAAALAVAAAPALLPPPLAAPALPLLTPAAGVAAAALGVSLFLIHIYVTPIKRTLQALWLLGVAGGTYLAAAHQETPLPLWVAQHPEGVWFVGPAFAALTGVAIKEGICYGKAEAAVLAAAVPTLLLSHLAGAARWGGSGSGAADGWGAAAELALLAVALAAGGVFAGRKWSQALRDDIGDKSVFMFQALPEEEQAAVVARLRRERGGR